MRLTVRQWTAVGCAAPIALLAVLAWHKRWVTDDAFIYLRVVDNLQDGLGPVFNPGERVEAFTSPLWLGILWVFSSLLWFASLEWIAVVLGILSTVAGMAAAARGALLLWRRLGATGVALPLGLLVLPALRPMWDFATSGLETGLTFAWLGASFWAVAVLHTGFARRLTPARAGVLIGLGLLVRPDLGVFAAGFMLALLIGPLAPGRAAKLRVLAASLALPVAYQVFRMGYFAALEPNTALAKEAGSAYWSRGWRYLEDFVRPYYLYLPFLALFGLAAYELRDRVAGQRRLVLVALTPVLCGLLHALYVVRLGGDFMHARMLLPSLFGCLLPVAVVVPSRRALSVAGVAAVLVWVAVCAISLRAPYVNSGEKQPVGDERGFYAANTGNPHPVTAGDYDKAAARGRAYKALSRRGRVLALSAGVVPANRVAAYWGTIGVVSYVAGPRVYIVDPHGLADPLAARLRLSALTLPDGTVVPYRQRAGHDKVLPEEWVAARFARTGAKLPAPLSRQWVADARHAIGCKPVRRLLEAVDAPLTAGRFFSNIAHSFEFERLRFSPYPSKAADELCG